MACLMEDWMKTTPNPSSRHVVELPQPGGGHLRDPTASSGLDAPHTEQFRCIASRGAANQCCTLVRQSSLLADLVPLPNPTSSQLPCPPIFVTKPPAKRMYSPRAASGSMPLTLFHASHFARSVMASSPGCSVVLSPIVPCLYNAYSILATHSHHRRHEWRADDVRHARSRAAGGRRTAYLPSARPISRASWWPSARTRRTVAATATC
mmetsp:Transcript_920/g.2451  ORF Transcript_920/g.2451 Transcript_920/m.2451 type:complete len:208 (-) Transcript_920:43-666(-)